MRDNLQDLIGLWMADPVFDDDLLIEKKLIDLFSEILDFDLPLDPMGFNHSADWEKILTHGSSFNNF